MTNKNTKTVNLKDEKITQIYRDKTYMFLFNFSLDIFVFFFIFLFINSTFS